MPFLALFFDGILSLYHISRAIKNLLQGGPRLNVIKGLICLQENIFSIKYFRNGK